MKSSEIRSSFLSFFEKRGHRIVPSASVIPYDDPTLLFTNAGMNQFKDVFLGTGKRDYVRAADSQKCIRVSGKHNDLEEVGRDTYHHTFFEMLGNWSFGDYYKREAIGWAWELLTKDWGLDKKSLYATVYESDDEAEQLWKKETDILPSHVLRFGKKDNFWEMGETGPCGPCSEIHIDMTDDLSGGKLVNAGDPRVMEIWNLVFIQYDRDAAGNLKPLPAKHVDTGMGFERICAALQGRKSNYDSDVFMPVIQRVSEMSRTNYTGTLDSPTDIAMRVIADHVRMLSFSIADGGIPSNEGRGYVMRRILRRAARFGRALGMHEPFIYEVVGSVVTSMGTQFPEIKEKQNHIERVIKGEEEGFNTTLDRGLEIFESVAAKMGSAKIFPGEDAFRLYDTYGFPLDMTEMMARERGLGVDTANFEKLMESQRERARIPRTVEASSQSAVDIGKHKSNFVGYDEYEHDAFIVEYTESGVMGYIVLDSTPFYTESGGQVADIGRIDFVDSRRPSPVRGVYRTPTGAIVHQIRLMGTNPVGSSVKARVDIERRKSIERNHSATHLVHEALRQVLGEHLHQQGSLVAPDHLRFDFNHFEKISPDQLQAVEDVVNEKVAESIEILALNDPKDWLTIDEAKRRYPNVKMFFGDKYGDHVRIVEIDPKFSVELCGGTHVKNTKDIGFFKIITEASIASGIRRIEAVTGEGLQQYIEKRLQKVGEMDEQIAHLSEELARLEEQLGNYVVVEHSPRPSLGSVSIPQGQDHKTTIGVVETALKNRDEAVETIIRTSHDLKKELSKYRVKEAASGIDELVGSAVQVGGFKVVSAKVEAGSMDDLKSLGDSLRTKLASGVGVLAAVVDEKAAFVCVVTDDLIKGKGLQAGKIVGELAKRVGGGGGGRPHLATAGGKDVSKIDQTLKETLSIVQAMVKG